MTTAHLDGRTEKHRLDALTDGIYSIAATLLVLELKLPPLAHGADNQALLHALLEVVPKGLTWLLSFWVMAMFWLAHVRMARLAAWLDATMVRVELWQLAFISLLPFTTALVGEHGNLVAGAAVYSANLAAIALVSWMRTRHFLGHSEMHAAPLAVDVATILRRRTLILLTASLVTLVLAFFIPGWNMLAMLLAVALFRFAGR